MRISDIEKIFINDLYDRYGSKEASGITWLCINHICKISRIEYLREKNRELNENELSEFYRILDAMKTGVPVQYALGETEFFGSKFTVDPHVLIPRPETEELVDWILKDMKVMRLSRPFNVLDIGTGSGCIPVIIKKIFPDAELFAIDISKDALNVAQQNAATNHTAINFIQDDILHHTGDYNSFSIIVSNPPYVTLKEKKEMHSNVLDHEPHTALFVPDDDPLVYYAAIADFAIQHLDEQGYLYLEINENYGQQTIDLLAKKGLKNIGLRKDLRDKDRMIRVQL